MARRSDSYRCLRVLRRAVQFQQPSSSTITANAHVLLATLLYYAGRPEEGLERIRKAMLIYSHYPFNYTLHPGQAYFTLERHPEAIDAFRQAIDRNPASERIHVWLAAALARSGKLMRPGGKPIRFVSSTRSSPCSVYGHHTRSPTRRT